MSHGEWHTLILFSNNGRWMRRQCTITCLRQLRKTTDIVTNSATGLKIRAGCLLSTADMSQYECIHLQLSSSMPSSGDTQCFPCNDSKVQYLKHAFTRDRPANALPWDSCTSYSHLTEWKLLDPRQRPLNFFTLSCRLQPNILKQLALAVS